MVVIGLGAAGSATLYQAAKLGARVIGIDRFNPPHDRGSSHGETRITRQAIGEGREFVPLVLRSHEIWEELEATTGRDLLTRNGGLILAIAGLAGSHHGRASFLQDTIDAAVEFKIPHQLLGSEEIRHRFPQFKLRGDESAYFEPGAGFVRPEACIEAQLSQAKRLGAKICTSEAVLKISVQAAGSIEVTTNRATYSTAHVVVTAGPWTQTFFKEDVDLFRIYRQVLNWFSIATNPERYSPDRCPVFIWLTGTESRDMLYGFPAVNGPGGGVKISTEQYDNTVDPDTVSRAVSSAEVTAMYVKYIELRLPDISGKCLRSETCLYTVTPDAKFVVDRLGDHEHVVVASACSGHGFKHSAALGEALARDACGLPSSIDLSAFRLRRFNDATR
jgi:sarcosine oxidase